jgi:hypothetical protein
LAKKRNNRISQHKDRKEDAKGKELVELKKENNQLKRQLARTSKQLNKQLHNVFEKEVEAEKEIESRLPKCQDCRSNNVKTLQLPTTALLVCKDCGWRIKL